MATDMDIEMEIDVDVDVDYTEDIPTQRVDLTPNLDTSELFNLSEAKPILSTQISSSELRAPDLVPHKIHLRGLESLTTNDLYAFAATYFDSYRPSQIEWIDDVSANLVYPSPEIASKALLSFSAIEIPDISQLPVLQTVQAKPFAQNPQVKLEVRRSVISDKKQAGARERSRFYLFNPEYDPSTRLGKGKNSSTLKKYRSRVDEGHHFQKSKEHEKYRKGRNIKFNAEFHDNDDIPNQAQSWKRGRGREHSSSSEVTERASSRVVFQKLGKELFPNREEPKRGRLRNRSASPIWNDKDNLTETSSSKISGISQQITSANDLEFRILQKQSKPNHNKELFPQRPTKHRLNAFDKKDVNIRFKPSCGVNELITGREAPQLSTYESMSSGSIKQDNKNISKIKIRGIANNTLSSAQDFSIKGAASGLRVKELFPTLADNTGKDIFARISGGRGQQRKAAKDLFS